MLFFRTFSEVCSFSVGLWLIAFASTMKPFYPTGAVRDDPATETGGAGIGTTSMFADDPAKPPNTFDPPPQYSSQGAGSSSYGAGGGGALRMPSNQTHDLFSPTTFQGGNSSASSNYAYGDAAGARPIYTSRPGDTTTNASLDHDVTKRYRERLSELRNLVWLPLSLAGCFCCTGCCTMCVNCFAVPFFLVLAQKLQSLRDNLDEQVRLDEGDVCVNCFAFSQKRHDLGFLVLAQKGCRVFKGGSWTNRWGLYP